MSAADLDRAARWLADQPEPPRPVVPELRRRYAVPPGQAIDIIRRAREIRRARYAEASARK